MCTDSNRIYFRMLYALLPLAVAATSAYSWFVLICILYSSSHSKSVDIPGCASVRACLCLSVCACLCVLVVWCDFLCVCSVFVCPHYALWIRFCLFVCSYWMDFMMLFGAFDGVAVVMELAFAHWRCASSPAKYRQKTISGAQTESAIAVMGRVEAIVCVCF